MSEKPLVVGDIIDVKTEQLAYGGEAIARYHGLAIFIPLAAPDETLRVKVVDRKRNFARASIEEILIPSPLRIEPRCKYFGDCGGCQLQHLPYENQLQAKVGFIRDALQRIAKMDWPEEIQIYSANDFHYRLRANFKIEQPGIPYSNLDGKGRPAERIGRPPVKVGFHRANSNTVCDVDQCEIVLPELNEALTEIRTTLTNPSQKNDYRMAEIDIAVGQNAIIDSQSMSRIEAISAHPPIHPFRSTPVERIVAGAVYRFDPSSFFQVNAFLLDDFVNEAIGIHSGSLAIDLYAGVGLFTVQLARLFQKVIGVEANQKAVTFAKHNLAVNHIENTVMVCERTDIWLKHFARQNDGIQPDLIILDPPRSGAKEAIEPIARLRPSRIHYISCDPNTLARDLKTLIGLDYQVERVVAFDLFPQTYHVETIVFLKKV